MLDHRLNSRTVYMNPINRFLYWNMNYHVEHHMFPMVPFHALPELHAEIKDDLPAPTPSIWAAYKEFVPAILRQRKDPSTSSDRRAAAADAGRRPASTADRVELEERPMSELDRGCAASTTSTRRT